LYDVLVKKFTFAISSPDEFLYGMRPCRPIRYKLTQAGRKSRNHKREGNPVSQERFDYVNQTWFVDTARQSKRSQTRKATPLTTTATQNVHCLHSQSGAKFKLPICHLQGPAYCHIITSCRTSWSLCSCPLQSL